MQMASPRKRSVRGPIFWKTKRRRRFSATSRSAIQSLVASLLAAGVDKVRTVPIVFVVKRPAPRHASTRPSCWCQARPRPSKAGRSRSASSASPETPAVRATSSERLVAHTSKRGRRPRVTSLGWDLGEWCGRPGCQQRLSRCVPRACRSAPFTPGIVGR